MTLSIYNVPKSEQAPVLAFIAQLNIREISEQVMQTLFQALAMHFDFSLSELTIPSLNPVIPPKER